MQSRSKLTNQATSAVTFDSSDSFAVLTGSNNGERRFTERLIHVQEMDSMGTASKNLSREV